LELESASELESDRTGKSREELNNAGPWQASTYGPDRASECPGPERSSREAHDPDH